MEKQLRKDINEVELQGKVLHKYATDKVTVITLTTGRATKTPNSPKVLFFGDIKDEAAKFNVGDKVRILGHIQSVKPNPAIKNHETLSIHGYAIEKANTQFEQDFDLPGEYVVPINHFKVSGLIVDVSIPHQAIIIVTVKTVRESRPSFVKILYFPRNQASVGKLYPGEYVRVSGYVQTEKRTVKDEILHTQSYVAAEIR